ncbi:MAG: hypothetical protein QF692_01055 [Alphaproteobacteria bacterium]|jgi:predicted component of type VI protein secretion system|nr:hypothetical protein [Alphaproteobacteria bacterium]MDP7221831.1 hypothetical protein [Alphaproteobacteria bacterium]
MASFLENVEMGWSYVTSLGDEEAVQATAIENLNDKHPGFQNFYTTINNDPALANALETITGQELDGKRDDGTQADYGYDEVDARLAELTDENPQFFNDLNQLLEKPGAQDFIQNLAADENMLPRLEALTNATGTESSPVSLVESLNDAVTRDPDFFDTATSVMQADGASQLLETITNDPGKMEILRDFASGDDTSPAALVNDLESLLDEDPQAFAKLNTILNAPGAEQAFETLRNSPEAMQNLSSIPGMSVGDMSPAGMIDMVYQGVDADPNFLVNATEAYGNYEAISAVNGFDELSQTLQQNPEIMTHLGDILGTDVGDMDNTAALSDLTGRLEALAEHDPAIFEKMNRVLNAEGAESFLATVAGNEALSNIVGGMAGGEMGNPESVSNLISGLDQRIASNPDYMVEATDVLQRSQGLIATFGEHAAGQIKGSDDALALMDQAIQTNNLFTGLQDGSLLSGIGDMFSSVLGPEYSGMISDFLAGIQEFLGPLFERIGGMLGGIMNADTIVSDGPASLVSALNPEGDPTVLDQDGQEQRPAGQQPQPQQPDTDRDNDMGLAPT